MPESVRIKVTPSDHVTATVYPAPAHLSAGARLILAHGAGADQASYFMVKFATELAARGVETVTFNFIYTELGRRLPDRNDRLEQCYLAVINALGMPSPPGAVGETGIFIGGKSMGGRIASQVASKTLCEVAGLIFLGYPLHPPGKPHQIRDESLRKADVPMLFVQGSRDVFGTPSELSPIIDDLNGRADIFVVEGGDHSFKIPKRSVISQDQMYILILNEIDRWIRKTI